MSTVKAVGLCKLCNGVTIEVEDVETGLLNNTCQTCGTMCRQFLCETTKRIEWDLIESRSTLHLYSEEQGYTMHIFGQETSIALLRFITKKMKEGNYDIDKSFYNYKRDGVWVRLTGRDVINESEGEMASTPDALKWFEVMVAGMELESPDTYNQQIGAYRRAIHVLKAWKD